MVTEVQQKLVECDPLQDEAYQYQLAIVRRKRSKIVMGGECLTPAGLLGIITPSCSRMRHEQLRISKEGE